MSIDEFLPYSVGALLYCPAAKEGLAERIAQEAFGRQFSMALCLEDTIADSAVEQAERQLCLTLKQLKALGEERAFYLPKIFIRVRRPEQASRLAETADLSLVAGFIYPKFTSENAALYIGETRRACETSGRRLLLMPILESGAIAEPGRRRDELLLVRDALEEAGDMVLNVRVGGNDLCNAFGLRRRFDETIYDIRPVADILSDIVGVFGKKYVISGPVWEYFDGPEWETGLRRELKLDRLNGFIGKTVIHPNQIRVVNQGLMAERPDYEDAMRILNWQEDSGLMVEKSSSQERMTEVKTHYRWAKKTAALARIYGVKE